MAGQRSGSKFGGEQADRSEVGEELDVICRLRSVPTGRVGAQPSCARRSVGGSLCCRVGCMACVADRPERDRRVGVRGAGPDFPCGVLPGVQSRASHPGSCLDGSTPSDPFSQVMGLSASADRASLHIGTCSYPDLHSRAGPPRRSVTAIPSDRPSLCPVKRCLVHLRVGSAPARARPRGPVPGRAARTAAPEGGRGRSSRTLRAPPEPTADRRAARPRRRLSASRRHPAHPGGRRDAGRAVGLQRPRTAPAPGTGTADPDPVAADRRPTHRLLTDRLTNCSPTARGRPRTPRGRSGDNQHF